MPYKDVVHNVRISQMGYRLFCKFFFPTGAQNARQVRAIMSDMPLILFTQPLTMLM